MGNKSSRVVSPTEKALQRMLTRPTALHGELFGLSSIAHHGLPSNARTLAHCGRQGLLAVGTASGRVKLYGAEGLEGLLEPPRTQSHVPAGVTHLAFTAQQRLVAAYANSALRIFDLAKGRGHVVDVPETWTTCAITCLETIVYQNYPFIFVALDDGTIHIIHEETGRASTYVISPRDLGLTTTEAERHLQVVTAMASNPRDANQLLVAYDATTTVFLWDLAKRKLAKDFTIAKPKSAAAAAGGGGTGERNSVQSLSWHSSGKRFVAGFKHGQVGIYRADKPHGLVHRVANADQSPTAIGRIHWMCAPPTSKHSHLPGAIVFSGGQSVEEKHLLTVLYPPPELSDEEAIVALVKSEQLTWLTMTIPSPSNAEILSYAVAIDQVDFSSRIAPFSLILLAGNPLDGCQPHVTIQCLPCFVRLLEEDREDWEWIPDKTPPAVTLPPVHLQSSQLKTLTVATIEGIATGLQDDLIATMDPCIVSPLTQSFLQDDFEWPVNGGSITYSLPSTASNIAGVQYSSVLALTAHENLVILFWELREPKDFASAGVVRLLHRLDVSTCFQPSSPPSMISCVCFCHESRTLVLGFAAGEIAVLKFCTETSAKGTELKDNVQDTSTSPDEQSESCLPQQLSQQGPGFRLVYTLHIHSSEIKMISYSSAYNYAAIADDAGVVSLIDLTNQNYELIIFDVSSDEPISVESLLFSELVQVTEVPNMSTNSKPGIKSPPRSPFKARRTSDASSLENPSVIQHREIVPVLFVGRGNGKLEMYHVHTAKKLVESLIDQTKSNSVASLIMVDADGKRVDIPGKAWGDRISDSEAAEIAPEQVNTDFDDTAAGSLSSFMVSDETRSTTLSMLREVAGKRFKDPARANDQLGGEDCGQTLFSSLPWTPRNVVEAVVPPGPLGLQLYTGIEHHAVVMGFVPGVETAMMLENDGVREGHAIVAINGVDLSSYNFDIVCKLLEKLRDCEKMMAFAQGYGPLPNEVSEVVDDTLRFLICACGKSVQLIPAGIPKASDIASGPKELHAQPLAGIELPAPVVSVEVIQIPIQNRVENCLLLVDQGDRLHCLSLPTLVHLWSADCGALGNALDGTQVAISSRGEVLIATALGEVERFTVLAEAVAKENAALARQSIRTHFFLEERRYPFDREAVPSPKKKGGMAALKKLVTGVKELQDLHKVIHFSAEADERQQVLGNRRSVSAPQEGEKSAAHKASESLNSTKDTLQLATQHLHERGEKLSDLALKTEQMKDTAEDFYKTMKAFNDKNANKKWYEL